MLRRHLNPKERFMFSASHPFIEIEGRPGGALMTMSYRLTDPSTGAWGLVDPVEGVLDIWSDHLARTAPSAVFITHPHFDHVNGLAAFRRRFEHVPVWVHPDGAEMLKSADRTGATWAGFSYEPAEATHLYDHGDQVELGRRRLHVWAAPGHCPGSVVLHVDDALLAGDVLFRGGVGRYDLPGANYDQLVATLRDQVMRLPDETVVYPGHGPATTIGEERRTNEMVRQLLA